ncbi:MAG: C-GCAxxG-C-C family protein [Fusobacteria bacterium]|nr:C-GCAxxG-C-C family protein [Fusobacteriota bacterium]
MILELLKKGYAEKKDLNCSEAILFAANSAYKLGLNDTALKLSSGFGRGMAVESVCGAISGAIMVLGLLTVESVAHQSFEVQLFTKELIDRFEEALGDRECINLVPRYRTLEHKCNKLIFKAAEILDEILIREKLLEKFRGSDEKNQ